MNKDITKEKFPRLLNSFNRLKSQSLVLPHFIQEYEINKEKKIKFIKKDQFVNYVRLIELQHQLLGKIRKNAVKK